MSDPSQSVQDALGLTPYLAHRQILSLPSGGHAELYPAVSAEAPLLIFLPGIGTYVELYAKLLYLLSQSGFNVAALDYPGHGGSAGERGLFTEPEVTQWVGELIDDYTTRRDVSQPQVGILGYSIGSLLALKVAESDERIQRLVCGTLLVPEQAPDHLHALGWVWISGAAFWTPWLKVPLDRLLDFKGLIQALPGADALEHDPRLVMAYPLTTLAKLFETRCDSVKCAQSFSMLVLHGESDEVLPLAYSQRLQQTLAQPFELKSLPGGHMLPWTATQRLVAEIHRWWLGVS